jgi:hypothetical protein
MIDTGNLGVLNGYCTNFICWNLPADGDIRVTGNVGMYEWEYGGYDVGISSQTQT